MKVIIAITGASGIVLGERLLEELKKGRHETHLIVSAGAEEVARHEECKSIKEIKKLASHVYDEKDLTASIASSSKPVDTVV